MVVRIWIALIAVFLFYSAVIYNLADVEAKEGKPGPVVLDGWRLWQKKNCQSCHQLYGLGGYMGPDLTNTASNPAKGKDYMAVFIKNGTNRMPNFHLTDTEVNHIVCFLAWVDKSGSSVVPSRAVNWLGNYEIQRTSK
jgi:nitric oxide reductase subunit C